MEKFNALDYWGKLAIKLTEENRVLKEKIVGWIIQLDADWGGENDATLTRDEMIKFLNKEFAFGRVSE
jgi:hypothetical protein